MEKSHLLPKNIDIISIEDTPNNKDILIRIPKSILIFSQERREDPIFIRDMEKMTKDFVSHFLDFGIGEYGEQFSKFHRLLDDWFLDRLEFGESYLEGENSDY